MEGPVPLENLQRWSETKPETAQKGRAKSASHSNSKFPVNPDINAKIVLWRGDICSIEGVHAIVHSTNESMSERNELSRRIFARAGRDLQAAVSALDGCKTGETRVTKAFNLPARFIIHTVGPRYNEKYQIAAENALHNCYRNCLQALVENECSSIAFCVIHSTQRGYPLENGAHIATRTVRRFLEKYGDSIDRVVFCMDSDRDLELYERILWMYFPRTKAEEREAITALPEDTGNEMGETVVEERKIRISTTLVRQEIEDEDDSRAFVSLAQMKESPDLQRASKQPPKPASSTFCALF